MEISPKLTSAGSLNATVSQKPTAETEKSIATLKSAETNNKEAAADISKLSSDPKSTASAEANRESARADVKDVDNLAASIGEKVKENPKQAFAAIGNLATDTVRSLLS